MYTHPMQRILVLKLGEVLVRLIVTRVNAAVDAVAMPRARVPAIATGGGHDAGWGFIL